MFAPFLRPAFADRVKLNDISPMARMQMAKNCGLLSEAEVNKACANQQKPGIVVGLPGMKASVKFVDQLLVDLGLAAIGGGGDFNGGRAPACVRLDLDLYAELVALGWAQPLPSDKPKVFVSSGKRG